MTSQTRRRGKAHHSVWVAAMLALAAFTISACNTVRGVGKDIEAAGQAIESAAGGEEKE